MHKIIILLGILFATTAGGPVLKITGSVYDEKGNSLSGVSVQEKSGLNHTITDGTGKYMINVNNDKSILIFTKPGYLKKEVKVGTKRKIDVILQAGIYEQEIALEESIADQGLQKRSKSGGIPTMYQMSTAGGASYPSHAFDAGQNFNTESYSAIEENTFHKSTDKPLSTFSIDVDAASYSNVRRFLNMGQMPPKDAVRIEEMINYFSYDYEGPEDQHPFAIHTAKMKAPWNEENYLVKIGIQSKKLEMEELPPSNIVFLLDVSGSMGSPNKLPLLKSSLKMLANELRPSDKVAIVVYAGAAGLVLPPTSGSDKQTIIQSLEKLQSGGSTAGGAGIKLAYEVAKENFVDGGNNRVILATDGDFNIGASSDAEMQRLIEEKRQEGVFLTVLGFGMGNYKDSKMEVLADKGNGNYAYIDNIMEAKKVLVTEFGGTLFTIAKDVKIQVEFNPNVVQAYRLIGYENRKLKDEDFNDDEKDAGELGSGHTVTALYEVVPMGVESEWVQSVDPLKYQNHQVSGNASEILTVKFRFKEPDGSNSKLITRTLANDKKMDDDANLKWAAAVSSFGMLLRDSKFKGNLTYPNVINLAKKAKGSDEFGYRNEFINLVEIAGRIQ
jgi:Ca-activated chloride channel family protein